MDEDNLPSFYYFRKITLTTCLEKARRGRESSLLSLLIRCKTHASWITTSTIQRNVNHQHLFIRIPMLVRVPVHSVDKTHVLVVTVKLVWLLFLNIFCLILFQLHCCCSNQPLSKLHYFFTCCALFKKATLLFFAAACPQW